MKKCTRCGSEGPFYKNKDSFEGLSSRCRECVKEINNFRRSKFPEKHRAQNKRYRENNPELVKGMIRNWTERNKTRVYEVAKMWVINNPEKRKSVKARHREKVKRDPVLKERQLRSHLKQHYDITLEKYNEMHTDQDGRCAICKMDTTGRKLSSRLSIDHDHETDHVRGLLCHHCNVLVGYAGDSVDRLLSAVVYLIKSRIEQGQVTLSSMEVESLYLAVNKARSLNSILGDDKQKKLEIRQQEFDRMYKAIGDLSCAEYDAFIEKYGHLNESKLLELWFTEKTSRLVGKSIFCSLSAEDTIDDQSDELG